MSLVHIENLVKSYGSTHALAGLSLNLEAGQIVGLLGENGAGKTTLINILAGLTTGYSGTVEIGGREVGPETKALVSYLPDELSLPQNLNRRQVLPYFSRFFSDFDEQKANELMDYFKLPEKKKIKTYSRGMKEKLQIALTIARQAQIYLLDEPISGVDPAARDVILNGILAQYNPEALFLISTHLIQDVESIIDTVVFMKEGRIMLHEQADTLRDEHGLSVDAIFRKVYAQ